MTTQRSHGAWWRALFVAALATAIYLNTLGNGFALDDDGAVVTNATVTGPFSLSALFGTDFWGLTRRGHGTIGAYRPFTTLTFAIDWHLGGGRPWLFHLTNALLHGLASAVFFFGARRITRSTWAPLSAATLFALHPLHTDAVSSIVGRADVLAFLACAFTWWQHRREGRRATALAALTFTIALLSKESSVTFLALLALGDLGAERAPLRERLTRYGLYALSFAGALALRHHVVGSLQGFVVDPHFNSLASVSLVTREVTALGLFGRATGLLIAPHTLLFDYGPVVVTPSALPDAYVALGAVSLAALVAIAVTGWRHERARTEAAAWMLVPGVLACNALVLLPMTFAERHWYLPSAGFLALVAMAFDRVEARRGARVIAALTVAISALYAERTLTRNRAWESSDSLALADVDEGSRSVLAHMNIAVAEFNRQRFDVSLARCRRITEMLPNWGTAWGCMGASAAVLHRDEEAERAYRQMRATGERRCQYRVAFARFLYQQGRFDEAREELLAMRRDGFWPQGASEVARAVRDARRARDAQR